MKKFGVIMAIIALTGCAGMDGQSSAGGMHSSGSSQHGSSFAPPGSYDFNTNRLAPLGP